MSISALRYKNIFTLNEAARVIADDNSSIESIILLLREKVGDGTIAAVRLVRFGRYDWDLGTKVHNANCAINYMETTIARDVLVDWLTQINYQPKPKLLFPDTENSVKPQPLPLADAAPNTHTQTSGNETSKQWAPKKPRRADALAAILFDVLKDAHNSGKPCPPTRDAMQLCKQKNPTVVFEITHEELKFYNSDGDVKTVTTEQLGKRIKRMTNCR